MLLSVENLSVSYDKIKALHGINFQVDEGEIVCIIGANGAGKSTTLRAISRLVPVAKETKMTYAGKDLLEYQPDKLATFARKNGDEIKNDLERVFSIFPRLEERMTQKAATLSGGEQQMLAVGRAFMSGRKLMLLDEPSMGLAPLLMLDMFKALEGINREGTTILLVEQNARMALQFAQRGYVLESGDLVLEGDSEDLLNNPEVKNAYLGG
jgi:branched-chain amino acid transport system ATP-binding protein